MMHTTPTVFVVDADYAVCRSLEHMLAERGWPVLTFVSPMQLLECLDHTARGCLVVDWRLPEMNCLELQAKLSFHAIELPVVVVGGDMSISAAVEAMEHGALTLLEKPLTAKLLTQAVERALAIDASRAASRETRGRWINRLQQLTHEELEVLQLMLAGRTSREIANDLVISPRTCDRRRSSVLAKFQVNSVPELALVVGTYDLLNNVRELISGNENCRRLPIVPHPFSN